MNLQITQTPDSVMAQLDGRLDTASAAQFTLDMQPLMDNAHKHIILDCASLEFISSSGLRLFLSLRKESLAKGGSVTIRNITPEVKQVFTITGFFSLFNFE